MKRYVLIRYLIEHGCVLLCHGKKHDIYQNPKNGKKAPSPRHNETKDSLSDLIKKQLEICLHSRTRQVREDYTIIFGSRRFYGDNSFLAKSNNSEARLIINSASLGSIWARGL